MSSLKKIIAFLLVTGLVADPATAGAFSGGWPTLQGSLRLEQAGVVFATEALQERLAEVTILGTPEPGIGHLHHRLDDWQDSLWSRNRPVPFAAAVVRSLTDFLARSAAFHPWLQVVPGFAPRNFRRQLQEASGHSAALQMQLNQLVRVTNEADVAYQHWFAQTYAHAMMAVDLALMTYSTENLRLAVQELATARAYFELYLRPLDSAELLQDLRRRLETSQFDTPHKPLDADDLKSLENLIRSGQFPHYQTQIRAYLEQSERVEKELQEIARSAGVRINERTASLPSGTVQQPPSPKPGRQARVEPAQWIVRAVRDRDDREPAAAIADKVLKYLDQKPTLGFPRSVLQDVLPFEPGEARWLDAVLDALIRLRRVEIHGDKNSPPLYSARLDAPPANWNAVRDHRGSPPREKEIIAILKKSRRPLTLTAIHYLAGDYRRLTTDMKKQMQVLVDSGQVQVNEEKGRVEYALTAGSERGNLIHQVLRALAAPVIVSISGDPMAALKGRLTFWKIIDTSWPMKLASDLAFIVIQRPDLLKEAHVLISQEAGHVPEIQSEFDLQLREWQLLERMEPLLAELKDQLSDDQNRELRSVAKFALSAHIDQPRDNGPYMVHLLGVVSDLVHRFGISDPLVLETGFLHDLDEDQSRFGGLLQVFQNVGHSPIRHSDDYFLLRLGVRMLTHLDDHDARYWQGLREPWIVYADDDYFTSHPDAQHDAHFLRYVHNVQLIKLADRTNNWQFFDAFLQPEAKLQEPALGRPERTFKKSLDSMLPQLVNHPDARFTREEIETFYSGLTDALFKHAAIDLAQYPAAKPLRGSALQTMPGLAAAIARNTYFVGSSVLQELRQRLLAVENSSTPGDRDPLTNSNRGEEHIHHLDENGKLMAGPTPAAARDDSTAELSRWRAQNSERQLNDLEALLPQRVQGLTLAAGQSLAQRMKQLRMQRYSFEISQNDLANLMNVPRPTISNMELGNRLGNTVTTRIRLAQAFGVPFVCLLYPELPFTVDDRFVQNPTIGDFTAALYDAIDHFGLRVFAEASSVSVFTLRNFNQGASLSTLASTLRDYQKGFAILQAREKQGWKPKGAGGQRKSVLALSPRTAEILMPPAVVVPQQEDMHRYGAPKPAGALLFMPGPAHHEDGSYNRSGDNPDTEKGSVTFAVVMGSALVALTVAAWPLNFGGRVSSSIETIRSSMFSAQIGSDIVPSVVKDPSYYEPAKVTGGRKTPGHLLGTSA